MKISFELLYDNYIKKLPSKSLLVKYECPYQKYLKKVHYKSELLKIFYELKYGEHIVYYSLQLLIEYTTYLYTKLKEKTL